VQEVEDELEIVAPTGVELELDWDSADELDQLCDEDEEDSLGPAELLWEE